MRHSVSEEALWAGSRSPPRDPFHIAGCVHCFESLALSIDRLSSTFRGDGYRWPGSLATAEAALQRVGVTLRCVHGGASVRS